MKRIICVAALALLALAATSIDATRYQGCIRLRAVRLDVFLFSKWYSNCTKLQTRGFVFPFGVIAWR